MHSQSNWNLERLVFEERGKPGYPEEKPLRAKEKTIKNNKSNPHTASMPGFEPGPHWWKASAVNIYMSLGKLPKSYIRSNRQQKRATCFATLLQNKLKSYV